MLEKTEFQLTRNGPILYGRLDTLRDRFATEHCVVLRNMLEAPLLEEIQQNIKHAQWQNGSAYAGKFGTLFTLDDPVALNIIQLLLNGPEFLNVIRMITGCKEISEFRGGAIYRMAAGRQHQLSWHSDLVDKEDRRVGFSMNLSTGVFRGGTFELRNRLTMKGFAQVNNTGFGDAILFRISRDLQHRVIPIMEGVPKTACTGWFVATDGNYVRPLVD
jgi:hypothetical protein